MTTRDVGYKMAAGPWVLTKWVHFEGTRKGGQQEGHTGNNGPLALLGVEKNKTDNMDAQA